MVVDDSFDDNPGEHRRTLTTGQSLNSAYSSAFVTTGEPKRTYQHGLLIRGSQVRTLSCALIKQLSSCFAGALLYVGVSGERRLLFSKYRVTIYQYPAILGVDPRADRKSVV